MSGLNLGNKPEKVEEVEEVEVDARAGMVMYSSYPIPNFRVATFQFKDSQLMLTPEEAETFDALHETMPPADKGLIKKIDVDAAERIAANYLNNSIVRGTDTSEDRPN